MKNEGNKFGHANNDGVIECNFFFFFQYFLFCSMDDTCFH